MKSKVSMCRTMLAAAVVMASTSGMAFANDDSVRWVPDNAPSAWRQSHPDGLSVREMQSLWGSWAGQYSINQPVFSIAAAEPYFRMSHPNGLSDRELQAMSSEAPAWQVPK